MRVIARSLRRSNPATYSPPVEGCLRRRRGGFHPVAWCHFSPIGDGYDIIYIYVRPTHRNQGIATKLIQNFIDKFNPASIMLEVRTSNTPAINLYKSLGFQTIFTRKNYYSNNEDAYVMKWNP